MRLDAGQVEVVVCSHPTHETLHDELLLHHPDVVHFVGHGRYDREQRVGELFLEDAHELAHIRPSLRVLVQAATQDSVQVARQLGPQVSDRAGGVTLHHPTQEGEVDFQV